MLAIEFIGHACFRIWENGKPTIMTDPYTHSDVDMQDDGKRFAAETVIMSSLTDLSHNNAELAEGNPTLINALDVATGNSTATINGEPMIAIPAAEIPDHPTGPDDNGMYAFKAGDLWFAHMGDAGFNVGVDLLQAWEGHCDVLLALTGAKYSLSLDELDAMIDFLQPKLIFPMHYHLPPPGGAMQPLSKFLNRRQHDPVLVVNHHTIQLPIPEIKSGHPTIVVLQPSGYTPTKPQLTYQ